MCRSATDSMTASACGARFSRRPTPVRTPTTSAGARRAAHQQVGGRIADDRRSGRLHAERIAEVDDHVGRWLHRDPVVGAITASTASATPRAASVRRVGSRSSLVAMAMRRPPARRPENSAGRSVSGWARSDRIRRVPRVAPAHASASSRERPLAFEQIAGLLAQPRHRRRGERRRRAGPSRSPGRTRASRTAVRRSSVPSRRRSRAASATAQPLHIGPNSMSVPSLSKTTRSIPVEEDRHTSSTTASARATSSRAAPSTKQASGGKVTVTGKPTPGSDRCGSLNLSSAMTLGG